MPSIHYGAEHVAAKADVISNAWNTAMSSARRPTGRVVIAVGNEEGLEGDGSVAAE